MHTFNWNSTALMCTLNWISTTLMHALKWISPSIIVMLKWIYRDWIETLVPWWTRGLESLILLCTRRISSVLSGCLSWIGSLFTEAPVEMCHSPHDAHVNYDNFSRNGKGELYLSISKAKVELDTSFRTATCWSIYLPSSCNSFNNTLGIDLRVALIPCMCVLWKHVTA